MDAYKAAHDKEQKTLLLQRRRLKLAKMLAEERDELYVSLLYVDVLSPNFDRSISMFLEAPTETTWDALAV